MTELFGLSGDYSLIAGLREDGRVLIVGEDPLAEWDSGTAELQFFDKIKSWRNVKKFIIGVCAAK